MKRIITTLFTAFAIAFAGFAEKTPEQEIPIPFNQNSKGNSGGTIFRAPALVPIHGYYSPMNQIIYIAFDYPMGNFVYRIENMDTGEYSVGRGLSDCVRTTIPFSGTSGTYLMKMKIIGGQEYIGMFSID